MQEGNIVITIFDLLGRRIRILFDGNQNAGLHKIQWDGLDENGQSLSSGVYVYQIQIGSQIRSKKMMMLK